jgi:ribosomal protein S27AE
MATIAMRQIREGEVPFDGGTAVQHDPERPVFHGNGPDDYVCVDCGNVLAVSMNVIQMTKKVRIRCGRCGTVNVSVIDGWEVAQFEAAERGETQARRST